MRAHACASQMIFETWRKCRGPCASDRDRRSAHGETHVPVVIRSTSLSTSERSSAVRGCASSHRTSAICSSASPSSPTSMNSVMSSRSHRWGAGSGLTGAGHATAGLGIGAPCCALVLLGVVEVGDREIADADSLVVVGPVDVVGKSRVVVEQDCAVLQANVLLALAWPVCAVHAHHRC
jgi:hypothetical protein